MGFFSRKPATPKPAATTPAAPARPARLMRRTSAVSHRALVRPVVSEKAAALGALRQYVFAVQPQMNKVEIAKVVSALYGVTPVAVNIIVVRGKRVRTGRIAGVRKSWKKAIVTLKAGESIEVYHGV